MLYRVRIEGEAGLIQHAGTGIDPETEINKELSKLTAKKAAQRVEAENVRIRDLEVIKSLWLDSDNRPTVPSAAIRSCIEAAARKLKDGPAVREGLLITDTAFSYDEKRYGTDLETIAKQAQYTVPVVVQRSRILRTRALFDLPWSVEFNVDADDDLVDIDRLRTWLDIAGRRIGLGDWRPQRSGEFGRFKTENIATI